MASNYNFYEGVDSFGRLIRVSKRFGKMREITMKKYDDDKIWIHLNDNSKCFTENKGFDISQSKYISMQYDDLLQLKSIIQELEPYKDKMIGESMMEHAQAQPLIQPGPHQQPPITGQMGPYKASPNYNRRQ